MVRVSLLETAVWMNWKNVAAVATGGEATETRRPRGGLAGAALRRWLGGARLPGRRLAGDP